MRNLRSILLLTSLMLGINLSAQNKVGAYHTIQKGETLFRLTQIYQVTAEAICSLNPGLSAQNFQAGRTVAIPVANGKVEPKKTVETLVSSRPEGVVDNCQEMYKVKKGDNLYRLSIKYGLTEEELKNANPELRNSETKLKKGSYICIPYKLVKTTKEVEPGNEELFAGNTPQVAYFGQMKIALMLPFGSTEKAKKASSMMFYRGFLLAVDSLKNQGVNMEITICDTGRREEKVDSLLRVPSIRNLDLLFCPMIEQSEHKISSFAKTNQIRLVLTQSNEVNTNPYLYSMNASNNQLYDDTVEFILRKFAKANFIVIDLKDTNSNTTRGVLTAKVRESLASKGIRVSYLSIDSSKESVVKALVAGKQNVILSNSASLPLMKKMVVTLKKVADENPNMKITLFGHKEWLSLANEMKTQFYALDTYIYSKYWFNPGNSAARQFAATYQHWFNTKLPTVMPSVPAVGFDTTYYMIKGLSTYGTAFEQYLNKFTVRPYQNFIEFERAGTYGGFVNRKVGFVHFNKKLVNVEYE